VSGFSFFEQVAPLSESITRSVPDGFDPVL
jgi:hypothetical protein